MREKVSAMNRDWVDQYRLEDLFNQQYGKTAEIPVEIRDELKGHLYGILVLDRRKREYVDQAGNAHYFTDDDDAEMSDEPAQRYYGGIDSFTLVVDEPSQSQISKALREQRRDDDRPPMTTQAKKFDVTLQLAEDGMTKAVARVDLADTWNFLKDARFRRSSQWRLPKSARELSRREIEILRSVKKFRKIKPGCDYEEEAKMLSDAGLISSPTGTNPRLQLTARGTEFLEAVDVGL